MRAKLLRFSKITAILLVLLVALAGLALVASKTPAFDEFLRDALISSAQEADVVLSLEGFDFDPEGPSVTIGRVKAVGPEGKWLAQCENLALRIHLVRSLSGTLTLSFAADSPTLNGAFGKKASDAPDLGGEREEGLPDLPDIAFHRLKITDGTVDLTVPSRSLALKLSGFELEWSHKILTGELAGGVIGWRGAEENIVGANFYGRRKLTGFEISAINWESQRLKVSASGSQGIRRKFGAGIHAELDVPHLPPEWLEGLHLGRFEDVGARATLDGEFSGTLAEPLFKAALKVEDARFGSLEIGTVSSALTLKREELGFNDFTADTSAGKVEALSGTLAWGDGLWLEAKGRGVDYDLRESMRLLFKERHFPVGLKVSGNFSARGPLLPKMALECSVEDALVRGLSVSTIYNGELREWYSLGDTTGTVEQAVVGTKGINFGRCDFDNDSLAVEIKRGSLTYAKGLEYDTDVRVKSLASVQRYLPEGFDLSGWARGHFGGPYRELEFSYEIELDEAKVFGQPLGEVKASAEYDLSLLTVKDLVADGPLGHLAAEGSLVTRSQGAVDLAVDWTGAKVEKVVEFINRFGVQSPVTLAGDIGAKGRVGGIARRPVLDGDVFISNLEVGGIGGFRGLSALAVVAHGTFGLHNWRADSFEMNAYNTLWRGVLEADRKGYELTVGGEEFDLVDLEEIWLPPVEVEGEAEVKLESAGNFGAPLTAFITTKIADGSVEGFELGGDVSLEVDIAERYTQLSGGRSDNTLDFEARAHHGEKFIMNVSAHALPFKDLPRRFIPEGLGGEAVTGKGLVELDTGNAQQPLDKIAWKGVVSGVDYKDLALGEVELLADYPRKMRSGETAIEFATSWWQGSAGGGALFSLEREPPAEALGPEIYLNAEGLDLQRFSSWGVTQRATLTATGAARLSRWPLENLGVEEALASLKEIEGSGIVENFEIREGVQLWPVKFKINSSGSKCLVVCTAEEVETLQIDLDPETLVWKISALLRDLDVARFAPALEGKLGARVSGLVTGEGKRFELDRISGEGTLSEVAVSQLPEKTGTWRGEWSEGVATISAELEDRVNVAARWAPADGVAGEVKLENAPLEKWLPPRKWLAEVKGKISGSIPFAVDAAGDVRADTTITALMLDVAPARIENLGDLEISFLNGVLNFDSVGLGGEGFDVGILGELELGQSWGLRAKVTADLAILGRNVPHIDALSGDGFVDLKVEGAWDSPEVSGALEVEGGSAKVSELTQAFNDITLKGSMKAGEALNIESFEATFGQGTLRGEGRWELDGYKPGKLDMLIEAREISYQYPTGVKYDFDADALITGGLEGAKVRGEVRVKSFDYTRRINWRSGILKLLESGKEMGQSGAEEDKLIYLDLAIVGDRDLRIENNVTELEFASDMRVRGYLPNPQLWGSIHVKSGTVKFRGRDFRLLRSNIEFLGDVGPNAIVDGRATTQVRQYMVNLSATGPLDDMRIDLSSVPPLPSTDIVALLALGTTSENLAEAGGVTAMEATSFLTGQIQDELEYQMNRILGFDQFHINPAYSETLQTTVPRVTVGRAISDSLYARYSAALDTQAEQEVSLEHALRPGITLLGSWADAGSQESGSFGGEIRFRVTFR